MNNPALKGEVSLNKMLGQISPRLRRFNIVSNSFTSCITNTPKKFAWTPKMSSSKILPQPSKAHANFLFNSGAQHQSLSHINNSTELNLMEDGNSSLCLKAEVSLPNPGVM